MKKPTNYIHAEKNEEKVTLEQILLSIISFIVYKTKVSVIF